MISLVGQSSKSMAGPEAIERIRLSGGLTDARKSLRGLAVPA